MRRPVLALCALLLVGAVLPVAASPQPSPVCGACGSSFESVAGEHVRNATVTHSTADVRFHENGSATWTVRNRFANVSTARYFRERPDLLRQVTRRSLDYGTVEGPFTALSVTVTDGRTVVLTYRDATAARTYPGGVLLTDYMHTHGYDTWPVLNVDRLTFVGPPGTEVTNDPAGATVSGRRATWTGNASAEVYKVPDAPTDAYVVFGDPGVTAGVWTGLAVALATLPTVLSVLGTYHLPPLALFALLLAGVARAETAVAERVTLDRRRVVAAVAGIGLLGVLVAGSALVGGPGHRATAAFGVVALSMAGVVHVRGDDATLEGVTTAGAVGLALVVLAHVLFLPNEYVTRADAFQVGFHGTVRLVPFVLAPALGRVPSGDLRERTLAGAVVAGGFLVGELAVVWPTERPFGLVILFLLAYAVVVAVGAFPFLLLGRVVGGE